jgi:hypothetical protein
LAFVSEVFAQHAVREARNADGDEAWLLVKKKRDTETSSRKDHDPHQYDNDKPIFFAHRLL